MHAEKRIISGTPETLQFQAVIESLKGSYKETSLSNFSL